MNNYLPGDELSIFGFSRGAYTARVLANFIVRLGILQTRYSWELKNAWKAYQEGKKKGEADGETAFDKYVDALNARVMKWDVGKEGVKERTQRTNIKIVGVFDTVGSVVGGTFYDPRLAKGVSCALRSAVVSPRLLTKVSCHGYNSQIQWEGVQDRKCIPRSCVG